MNLISLSGAEAKAHLERIPAGCQLVVVTTNDQVTSLDFVTTQGQLVARIDKLQYNYYFRVLVPKTKVVITSTATVFGEPVTKTVDKDDVSDLDEWEHNYQKMNGELAFKRVESTVLAPLDPYAKG